MILTWMVDMAIPAASTGTTVPNMALQRVGVIRHPEVVFSLCGACGKPKFLQGVPRKRKHVFPNPIVNELD